MLSGLGDFAALGAHPSVRASGQVVIIDFEGWVVARVSGWVAWAPVRQEQFVIGLSGSEFG